MRQKSTKKLSAFSCLEIYWKSTETHLNFWVRNLLKISYFLGQKSIEYQLIFLARNLLKINSISLSEIYWKLLEFLGQKSIENLIVFLDRNLLKINSIFWSEISFITSISKSIENQLVIWRRNPLKISYFSSRKYTEITLISGAEIIWKSARFPEQISILICWLSLLKTYWKLPQFLMQKSENLLVYLTGKLAFLGHFLTATKLA